MGGKEIDRECDEQEEAGLSLAELQQGKGAGCGGSCWAGQVGG